MKLLMKLPDRQLSLLAGALVFFGMLLIFLPIVLFGIFEVVQNGEARYTQIEANRAENILRNELDQLDQLLHSISSWNDTYQFVQDKNQAYIDYNLSLNMFVGGNIDVYIALDASNDLVFAKYIDSQSNAELPLPFTVSTLLQAYPVLQSSADIRSNQAGLVYFAGQPMMVAARPILTSLEKGPAQGTLIFCRFLGSEELDAVSQITQQPVKVVGVSGSATNTVSLPAAPISKSHVFVQPRDAETSIGSKYLYDLNDAPALVLSVENPRHLYRMGVSAAWVFTGALLLLGFVLFAGTYDFSRSLLKARKASQRYLVQFQMVVDKSRDAMLLVRDDFRLLLVNPASRQLLGLNPGHTHSAILKSILTFEPDLDRDELMLLCQGGTITEHHCTRRDGLELDVELSASLISESETFSGADSGARVFSLTLHDVTARKKMENVLKVSEERYMLAANGSMDGLWDWNLMNGEIYYSARWKDMLGFGENEITPATDEWFSRVHPEDIVRLRTLLSDHLCARSEHFECEYRILHRSGSFRWMLARGLAVWDPAGYAHRIAGSQTDITERKGIEEKLRFDALHDGLTGMANRTLLLDHLKQANERKKRNIDQIFALFFLDLDRFKQVNDSLGHQAGDQLLVEAARRLEYGLRSVDTVSRFTGPETLARIAGDEFVILLEDIQSIEAIFKIAERITTFLDKPYLVAGQELRLSVSIGVVVPEQPYESVEDIIRDADIAMYQAKQLGGGQVVRFHPEMYQETLQRMQVESELRQAVEHQEFEVYYQPIYTIGNDLMVGFEALVRWNHPRRGPLNPTDFIQVAEDSGLIVPIGYQVLEEACRKMVDWSQAFPKFRNLIVSVNFSSRQIMNSNLVEKIRSILDATGFDPKKLWLEVTESMLVEKNEVILARLSALRVMGIRIEIDDFGTGYSSLSYLQNLPIDGFKIDRSFVQDIQGDGRHIVKTLVDLGHSMGLTEVAEGVETNAQKEYLQTVDCDYFQGFLMSHPLDAQAIENLIRKLHNN